MTLYRKLSRNPKQFLTVTGMNLHQFQALLPKFTQAFEQQEHKRKAVVVKTKAARQRGAGGGSQFAHELYYVTDHWTVYWIDSIQGRNVNVQASGECINWGIQTYDAAPYLDAPYWKTNNVRVGFGIKNQPVLIYPMEVKLTTIRQKIISTDISAQP